MVTFRVKDVSFGEQYYGLASNEINTLIPKTIPYKFQKPYNNNPWRAIATAWFEQGIRKESVLTPVYGIDKEKAIKHIQCLFNTWTLSKEEKVQNGAFLLSQWFTEINL